MALTTIERVRAYLGQSIITKDDDVLLALLDGASTYFETKASRTIASATYTDVVDGNGTSSQTLQEGPVIAVTEVSVDGEIIPQRDVVTGEGWVLQGSTIRLVSRTFTKGISNVEITYSAGWTEIPEDIQLAVCELVALAWNERQRPGVFSKSTPDLGSTQFQVLTLPVRIADVIKSYSIPTIA